MAAVDLGQLSVRGSGRFCPNGLEPGLLLMNASTVRNIVVDEANQRTYVVLASRELSDGEIYKTIRQELLRRGGKPVPRGETLTLSLVSGATDSTPLS